MDIHDRLRATRTPVRRVPDAVCDRRRTLEVRCLDTRSATARPSHGRHTTVSLVARHRGLPDAGGHRIRRIRRQSQSASRTLSEPSPTPPLTASGRPVDNPLTVCGDAKPLSFGTLRGYPVGDSLLVIRREFAGDARVVSSKLATGCVARPADRFHPHPRTTMMVQCSWD